MKKVGNKVMKNKETKITFWSILGAGFVALIVCYCVIPTQTQLAFDKIVEYLNTPLFIIGGSSITIGIVLFVLIRYALKNNKEKIRDLLNESKTYVQNKEISAKEYLELAKQKQEETKVILTNYDERIETLFAELEKVCETIPNAKVKALGSEIKEKYLESKECLKTELDNIDEYIIEKTPKFDYEKAYEDLVDRLGKLEKEYGEREETING